MDRIETRLRADDRSTRPPGDEVRGIFSRVEVSAAVAAIAALTPHQKRVLDCLVEGMSNKVISFRLGVAISTVKAHLSAIFIQLGCANRTEAAIIALRYRRTKTSDA